MVRITLKSEEDHANGLYCLALNGRVRCLRGGVFELHGHMLDHLDREGVRYSIVSEALRRDPSPATRST